MNMNPLADGNKTYSLVIAAILAAASAYLGGEIDLSELIKAIMTALGFATVRHGVATAGKKES